VNVFPAGTVVVWGDINHDNNCTLEGAVSLSECYPYNCITIPDWIEYWRCRFYISTSYKEKKLILAYLTRLLLMVKDYNSIKTLHNEQNATRSKKVLTATYTDEKQLAHAEEKRLSIPDNDPQNTSFKLAYGYIIDASGMEEVMMDEGGKTEQATYQRLVEDSEGSTDRAETLIAQSFRALTDKMHYEREVMEEITEPLLPEIEGSGALILSPNPSSDRINLHYTGKAEIISYVIKDKMGREIASGKTDHKNATGISVSDIPVGLYLITVRLDNAEFISTKFIRNEN